MVVRDAAEPVHDAILLFYLYCTSRISIFEAVNFSGRALLAIHTTGTAASYGRYRHSSKNVVVVGVSLGAANRTNDARPVANMGNRKKLSTATGFAT